jgi:hypothetical protein
MKRKRWLRAGLAVLGVIALTGAEQLDPGEIHCEEAVKHLAECCGESFQFYDCTAGRGCDGKRPDLDDPLASNVRDSSCEQLIAQGACMVPPRSPRDAGPTPPDFSVPPDLSHPHDLSHPADLSEPGDLFTAGSDL